jgi:hypothetical protein
MSSIEFEQRRKELLDKISAIRHGDAPENAAVASDTVVVFAAKSPFIDGLMATVGKKHPVRQFWDSEEASGFCIDHPALPVIIHMDLPTDWKSATDVFTAVKTVNPTARVMLCTKTPSSVPVQTLVTQKAEVLAVPFSAELLFEKLKPVSRA